MKEITLQVTIHQVITQTVITQTVTTRLPIGVVAVVDSVVAGQVALGSWFNLLK